MSFCTWARGEKYRDWFENGIYVCAKCSHPLFSSKVKFAHSSPWPAFTETISKDSVYKRKEKFNSYKVLCGKCGRGIGHEFINEGPKIGQSRF